MATGGNTRFPTLQLVADLFRFQINDTFTGADGSGLIMPNTNPDLLTLMNAAIRDMYSDLRNVGDPALILDNYIVTGLPALSASDPSVQVSLDTIGFFDGTQVLSDWTLPTNCREVFRVWERTSGSGAVFSPMTAVPVIPPIGQGAAMGVWEYRQNAVWMPGATESVDLRVRCSITFPDFLDPETIDFKSTYIPIVDCVNCVADKMCVRYARRFAPDQYGTSKDAAEESLFKLKQETVRQMQVYDYKRIVYGWEATAGFGTLAQL